MTISSSNNEHLKTYAFIRGDYKKGERMLEKRFVKESRCYKIARIFPNDVNNHNTLFGGKLMSYIDDIASISASKHCRK